MICQWKNFFNNHSNSHGVDNRKGRKDDRNSWRSSLRYADDTTDRFNNSHWKKYSRELLIKMENEAVARDIIYVWYSGWSCESPSVADYKEFELKAAAKVSEVILKVLKK